MARITTTAKTTVVAIEFAAAVVMTTLSTGIAYADPLNDFKTPSGNIYCQMAVGPGGTAVACEGGGPYGVPAPDNCHGAWGDRFIMTAGGDVVPSCHTDTIRSNEAQAPVLEYGQTKSIGTITCDSETTGLTCTDSSTGRFFSMSREANVLG